MARHRRGAHRPTPATRSRAASVGRLQLRKGRPSRPDTGRGRPGHGLIVGAGLVLLAVVGVYLPGAAAAASRASDVIVPAAGAGSSAHQSAAGDRQNSTTGQWRGGANGTSGPAYAPGAGNGHGRAGGGRTSSSTGSEAIGTG